MEGVSVRTNSFLLRLLPAAKYNSTIELKSERLYQFLYFQLPNMCGIKGYEKKRAFSN